MPFAPSRHILIDVRRDHLKYTLKASVEIVQI